MWSILISQTFYIVCIASSWVHFPTNPSTKRCRSTATYLPQPGLDSEGLYIYCYIIKIEFSFSEPKVETPDVSASFTLPSSMFDDCYVTWPLQSHDTCWRLSESSVSTFGSEKVNSIFIRWILNSATYILGCINDVNSNPKLRTHWLYTQAVPCKW